MERVGTRAQVMHGNAKQTAGGLKKKDLKYNKQGKIVSKKMSQRAKKEKRLQKAGYTTKKGQFGAFKMRGGGKIRVEKLVQDKINPYHLIDGKWKTFGNDHLEFGDLIIYRYNDEHYVSDCKKYIDNVGVLQPVLFNKKDFNDAKLTFINVEINENELGRKISDCKLQEY